MFKWLSWARSYYLYAYYFCSWDVTCKEYRPSRGFMAMMGFFMIAPAMTILGALNKWHYFLDDSMREHLFNFRGSVNYIVLLGALVSFVLTYLVCCVGIKFDDIGQRLAKIPYFAERKFWKLFMLWVFNLSLCLIVSNYLYKYQLVSSGLPDAFGNALGNSIVAGLSAKSGPSAENGKLSAKEQAELDQKMAAMDRSVQNRMAGKTEDGATYTSDGVRTYGTTAKVDSSGNVNDLSGNFHINAKELRDVVNNKQWDVLGRVMSLRGDDELAFGGDAILGREKAGFLRNELNIYADEAHGRIELANKLGLVSLTGITSSLTGALRAVSRGVSDNVVPAAREVLRDSALRTRTAVLENYHNVAPKHASVDAWGNFKTNGLTRNDAASFLKTNQGQELFALLKVGTSEDVAYRNFFEIITSGTNLPQKVAPETLYKIITAGKVGENTAYFATAGELEKLGKSGKTVADYFGLPGANEAPIYNLFEMQPKTPASAVFRSTIAPATDNVLLKQFNQPVHLNINRSGMGQQYIVPNRNEWGEPVFLRQIGN